MSEVRTIHVNHPSAASGGITFSSDGKVAGGGVDLLLSESWTAQTEVNFDDVFSDDYTHYRMLLSGLCIGVQTDGLMMRMRTGGASDATSGAYGYGSHYTQNGTTARLYGTSSDTFGLVAWLGNVNTVSDLTIFNPNIASPTQWCGTMQTRYDSTDTAAFLAGSHHPASPYAGFSLHAQTGGPFSGSLLLYGLGKV